MGSREDTADGLPQQPVLSPGCYRQLRSILLVEHCDAHCGHVTSLSAISIGTAQHDSDV